jgi:hypothetical protein
MHFEADTEVVVPPVGTASITLNGRAYQAHAMDAHEDDVAPDGCSFADTPGIYAWAVTR